MVISSAKVFCTFPGARVGRGAPKLATTVFSWSFRLGQL
jgi:hypothetical protein